MGWMKGKTLWGRRRFWRRGEGTEHLMKVCWEPDTVTDLRTQRWVRIPCDQPRSCIRWASPPNLPPTYRNVKTTEGPLRMTDGCSGPSVMAFHVCDKCQLYKHFIVLTTNSVACLYHPRLWENLPFSPGNVNSSMAVYHTNTRKDNSEERPLLSTHVEMWQTHGELSPDTNCLVTVGTDMFAQMSASQWCYLGSAP